MTAALISPLEPEIRSLKGHRSQSLRAGAAEGSASGTESAAGLSLGWKIETIHRTRFWATAISFSRWDGDVPIVTIGG